MSARFRDVGSFLRGSATSNVSTKIAWLVASVLCLAYLAQCAWFIRTQSLTSDEPPNLLAGYQAWKSGQFQVYNTHPPLARLLFTLPLLSKDWEIMEPADSEKFVVRPDAEELAWRTRPVNALLGLVLALALYFTARRMFSQGGALLVLALFAFSAVLIAHFSVTNTDGIVTLTLFLSVIQLVRWRRDPGRRQTVLLGVALGCLLDSKHSALPMFCLAMLFMLVLKPQGFAVHPRAWNWGQAATCVAIAFAIVWATYFFHVSKVSLGDGRLTYASPSRALPQVVDIPLRSRLAFYIPAGEYLEGLYKMFKHNRKGTPGYLLGEIRQGGWRIYFPVAMALKWPVTVLVLFAAVGFLALRRSLSLPPDLYVMAAFPAVFLLLSIFADMNAGVRHVLPAYPFLLLSAGAAWEYARRRRVLSAFLIAAVLFHVGDCLRYAPDYLSYFNIYAQPKPGREFLSDSNLDWGQGLIALRNYQAQHPDEHIHLAYFGIAHPSNYGIRATPFRESARPSGTVIVSATYFTGQLLRDSSAYRWLLNYPLRGVLNHSLYVFEVPAEDAAPGGGVPHR